MNVDINDIDYENQLEALSTTQIQSLEDKIEEVESELDEESFRKNIKKGLQDEIDHDDLIKAAASAFLPEDGPGTESDYEFAFTEPLEEKGVKNADLLLVKEERENLKLCLVECKTGQDYSSWVKKMEGVKNEIEKNENRKELRAQLERRDKEINHVEYVILAEPQNGSFFNEDNFDDDRFTDFAIWSVDKTRNILFRQSEKGCKDKSLSRVMKEGVDYGTVDYAIDYTLGSHPVRILQEILFEIVREGQKQNKLHKLEFNREEFYEKLEKSIQIGVKGTKREEMISGKVEHILEKGERFGILTSSRDEVRSSKDFRIKFQGSKPTTCKDAVKRKYLKNEPVLKLRREAFKQAIEELDLDQQSGLGDFTD